jgi:PadR family transcriptional regulator, regulatory protein PadR
MTIALATVLRVFLDDVTQPRYGYELMRLTGYPSGKLYPVLARLEQIGWLTKEIEQIDPSHERRPARRLYRISEAGIQAATSQLTALSTELRPPPQARSPLRPQSDLA